MKKTNQVRDLVLTNCEHEGNKHARVVVIAKKRDRKDKSKMYCFVCRKKLTGNQYDFCSGECQMAAEKKAYHG